MQYDSYQVMASDYLRSPSPISSRMSANPEGQRKGTIIGKGVQCQNKEEIPRKAHTEFKHGKSRKKENSKLETYSHWKTEQKQNRSTTHRAKQHTNGRNQYE